MLQTDFALKPNTLHIQNIAASDEVSIDRFIKVYAKDIKCIFSRNRMLVAQLEIIVKDNPQKLTGTDGE